MPDTTLIHRGRTTLGWLLAPATEAVPRPQAVGAAALRILLGLLWLYNVSWKRAPDFGQDADNGLFKFTSYAVSHPVFAPYSWVVEHLVLPVFTPFGWMVLVAETTLAVLLLTGAWVRLAAAIGVAQSLAIALSVAYAPNEWPWSYWLMIGAHVVILFSSAGRVLAVDGLRAGLLSSRALGQFWGGLTTLLGAYSVVRSFGDPLAVRGPGLVSSNLSISLGEYNLLGGLVLVIVGVLMVTATRGGPRAAVRGAAVLAALAGLSLHAQLGFTDPILGGTATSAAYYFSVAVVALFLGAPADAGSRSPSHDRSSR
ncbi:hypothetical protein [Nocardioides sp.]|uniref:Rv1678 family membrane protein n=1 Tax=Nocardioides sp. TaxID=35761 RepID=UPI00286DD5D9|nr:hypothetical protein [Nocardioides sp.]